MARGTAGRVLQIAQQHRESLLRMERGAASQMVRAYGGIWQRLRSDLDDLMAEYEQIPEDDAKGMLNWLLRQQRLETLLQQTEAEVGRFAGVADERIQQGQRAAIEASQQAAQRMVYAQAPDLDITWNRLPTEMIETIVGTTADGSPLRELLDQLGPEASEAVRRGLIEGTAMGDNPREVARAVRKQFGKNLGRALTVSRTEMLRAAREATRQSYLQNSDVVGQWKWLAAKQGRTCAMCLAMDGTLHDLDEVLDDHPNGRCTSVPVVKGAPAVQWQDGKAWLEAQGEATQKQVLGGAGYEAYQAGAVNLSDFVGQRTSADWGTTRYAKSLTGILGDKAKEFTGRPAKEEPVAAKTAPRFESAAEAGGWLKTNGYVSGTYFKSMDVPVAQGIADSLVETGERFPQDKGIVGKIGSTRELNAQYRADAQAVIDAEMVRYRQAMEDGFRSQNRYDEGQIATLVERSAVSHEKYLGKQVPKVKMMPNAIAQAYGARGDVFISDQYLRDGVKLTQVLEKSVETGWSPPGAGTIKAVIDHEIMHVVDGKYHISRDKRLQDIAFQAKKDKMLPSRYAATNMKEFLCESWSEYVNSPNPRGVATEVGHLVESIVKGGQ